MVDGNRTGGTPASEEFILESKKARCFLAGLASIVVLTIAQKILSLDPACVNTAISSIAVIVPSYLGAQCAVEWKQSRNS